VKGEFVGGSDIMMEMFEAASSSKYTPHRHLMILPGPRTRSRKARRAARSPSG
jgi:hypothetical protein